MSWRTESWTEAEDGKVIILRRKPRRPSVPQTLIDHAQSIERRRANAALYDRMTQILTQIAGGKLTKGVLMRLAERIADQKRIKIDRGARRMKDCLICWFCEQATDLTSSSLEGSTEPMPAFPEMDIDDFDILPPRSRDDDMPWSFEPDGFG
jgi:hypothetical protein